MKQCTTGTGFVGKVTRFEKQQLVLLFCKRTEFKQKRVLRLKLKCGGQAEFDEEKWQDPLSVKKPPNLPQLGIPELGLQDSDWREFRAKLVQLEQSWSCEQAEQQENEQFMESDQNPNLERNNDNSIWAHLISSPEQGSLLISRASDLGFFNNTAVLLLQHEDRRGSLGLILNRPSPLTVKDVFTRPDVTHVFGKQIVYFGGPVGYDRVNVVHSKQVVKGVSEILTGVYLGGIEDACKMVQEGSAKAEEFRLMFGYCGWDPFQLAAELHDDTWYTVSASRQLILQLIFDTTLDAQTGQQTSSQAWQFLQQTIKQIT